jgi:hypothetical protein
VTPFPPMRLFGCRKRFAPRRERLNVLPMFWGKKKADIDDIANLFVHKYCDSLVKNFAPDAVLPFLTDVAAQSGPDIFNREWVIVNMFVFSEAFLETLEGIVLGEQLVKRINNLVFEIFSNAGVFDKEVDKGLLNHRCVEYYDEIKIRGDFFKGVADKFLGILNRSSGAEDFLLNLYLRDEYAIMAEMSKAVRKAL